MNFNENDLWREKTEYRASVLVAFETVKDKGLT